MTSKQQLAALAVAAGRDMVRIGAQHGIHSDIAKQAAHLADKAARAAEAAGCAPADYARARHAH
ncbi:hypothetical protein [Streptomyces thermolilacinus]|uniref:Uncharacterized protein n=1 Tax=Streptomyces thermolilacinus SPC6 TaxID=1306406 RepID=A0A1D3DV81_9ACTN|nr:hypothetical protein [Streptomyces thermolilacinus]OEJ96230.1 hypothetical protein J116_018965 [Streptomyces thermolilacinus SPC6]